MRPTTIKPLAFGLDSRRPATSSPSSQFLNSLESGRTILSLNRTPHGKAHASGPPLWGMDGAEHQTTPNPAHPTTSAYEFDQRIAW